jgi:hypothetical protein
MPDHRWSGVNLFNAMNTTSCFRIPRLCAFTPIEPLEARIAPAGASVTYTDADGDTVKITASTGPLDAGDLLLSAGATGQLSALNLSDVGFAGANITFTVTKHAGGDGLADVGFIIATGIDLGNVTVRGDLGRIVAGDGDDANGPSLKTLSVRSMGRFGLDTQAGTGDLSSAISGKVVALKVSGDMEDALFVVTGSINSAVIGGSLLYGEIFASTDIGSVRIGKNLVGGDIGNAGLVQANGKIGQIRVAGSVIGGGGAFAGAIRAATLGAVKIGQDLAGGTGDNSGTVTCPEGGTIASVSIGGSIRGGAGLNTGAVIAGDADPLTQNTASAGNVTVKGSVLGGRGMTSGVVYSSTTIGLVKIGADVSGGMGQDSGIIFAADAAGGFAIGGSLLGGSGAESGVVAVSKLVAGQTVSGPIAGSLTVGGSVIGGSASSTGIIGVGTVKGKVTIGGSLIGRAIITDNVNDISNVGVILVNGDCGPVRIAGDIIGGSIASDGSLDNSGILVVFGDTPSIFIGGSVVAGHANGTPPSELSNSGSIVGFSAGRLTIKGDVLGNETQMARIIFTGKAAGLPGKGLGPLTIGGNVEWGLIAVAGAGGLTPTPNAQIGAVKVGGDWVASSLLSGVDPVNNFVGDGDDVLVPGAVSRIASITIGGRVLGSSAGGDHFGFVAHEIGAFKVRGASIARSAGIDPAVDLAYASADVTLLEL